MVGMLQIITYLLCVYLIYKGFEIFQIALMSNREARAGGLAIGLVAILASFALAALFVYWIDLQATKVAQK
jgi:hypothetical protein